MKARQMPFGVQRDGARKKNTYKHERSLSSGLADPATREGYSGGKEVGDAHSSVDRRDNITRQERRGITASRVSEVRRTF